jgi:hypothetical protein
MPIMDFVDPEFIKVKTSVFVMRRAGYTVYQGQTIRLSSLLHKEAMIKVFGSENRLYIIDHQVHAKPASMKAGPQTWFIITNVSYFGYQACFTKSSEKRQASKAGFPTQKPAYGKMLGLIWYVISILVGPYSLTS